MPRDVKYTTRVLEKGNSETNKTPVLSQVGSVWNKHSKIENGMLVKRTRAIGHL